MDKHTAATNAFRKKQKRRDSRSFARKVNHARLDNIRYDKGKSPFLRLSSRERRKLEEDRRKEEKKAMAAVNGAQKAPPIKKGFRGYLGPDNISKKERRRRKEQKRAEREQKTATERREAPPVEETPDLDEIKDLDDTEEEK